MNKIIYIDFDGVLVDTPKFINMEIQKSDNVEDALRKLPWKKFFDNCSEINHNIKYIRSISKRVKIIILTHVYSKYEAQEKEKYISEKLKNIEIITVPYFIKKCDVVNAYGNILIDDYSVNISAWNDAGGIGICLKSSQSIDNVLKDYLFDL